MDTKHVDAGGSNLQQALKHWRLLLGRSNVVDATSGQAELAQFAQATFKTTQQVSAVLRPADGRQVRECVRIANQYNQKLYPISGGKNWGYGSRVPPTDAVALDLVNLNQISDFNEALGYVTLGAGVTFAQLAQFLKDKDSRLLVQAPGSTAQASIIGNVLERGFGQGPAPDRVNNVCAMQVVLPNAQVLQTGARGRGRRVHRLGLGPAFDSVFSQSNLGIVTELTLWLPRRPANWQHLRIVVSDDRRLEVLVDKLQEARRDDLLDTQVSLFNNLRLLSLEQRFPFAEFDPARGMTVLEARQMARAKAIPDWYVEAGVAGATPEIVNAKRQQLEALLGSLVKLEFGEICGPSVFYSNAGQSGIQNAYWRCRAVNQDDLPAQTLDPDADRCGIYQMSAVAEFSGADVREACNLVNQVTQAHAFEAGISVQCMDQRLAYVIVTLSFDLTSDEESARAELCHKKMAEVLRKFEFFPYRSGLQSYAEFAQDSLADVSLLKQFRGLLDPNDVLAPGRYDGLYDDNNGGQV